MPLNFSNIQGISSTLSLTNVFSPLPCCFKYDKKSERSLRFKLSQKYMPVYPLGQCVTPYVETIKISCLLETSNQWPEDLECIKRLKCAFSIKLSQLLRDVGLLAFTNVEFCDVFYKGYVFRLIIHSTREMAIVKSSVDEMGIILSRDTEESVRLEKNIFHLTKLTSVLHALQQEYNHFSGVARLAKRWLSCQLLLDYYNEEAIDLLCAYLFVHPEPFEAPK
jgi:U3 small nucleolar RNA-associated protein 22